MGARQNKWVGSGAPGVPMKWPKKFLGSGDLPPGIYPYGLFLVEAPPKKRGCIDPTFDIIETLFSGLFTISNCKMPQFTLLSEQKQMAKNGKIKNYQTVSGPFHDDFWVKGTSIPSK